MLSWTLLLLYTLHLSFSNGYVVYENPEEITKNEIDNEVKSDGNNLLYDLTKEVKFYLYTRSNPLNGVVIKNIETLKQSTFDNSKPTKFVTHGFRSSGFSDTCQEIKDEYLKYMDVNVFVMDWKNIAGNLFYFIPAVMTVDVGKYYAKFVDQLVEYGSDPKEIHLIGHSLGAHISGFTGQFTTNKVGRITGLDPAFPSFGLIQLVGSRLNKDQAFFVDVIHTSAGTLGLREPIGHIDFYPNGGTLPQPGCGGIDEIMQACSHGRSWQYFKESINPDVKFACYKSENYESFLQRRVQEKPEFLGEYVSTDARGMYYLKTNAQYPFATKSII